MPQFFQFSFLLVSFWSEKILHMSSVFLNLLRLVLFYKYGLFKGMFLVHLKRICILLSWGRIRSIWFVALFKSSIFLFIFGIVQLTLGQCKD